MSTKGIIRFGVFTMCFAAAVGGMCGMFAISAAMNGQWSFVALQSLLVCVNAWTFITVRRNVIQLRRMNDA